MKWSDFSAEAYNLTEAEISKLSELVIEQYQLAYESISLLLESQYAKLTGVKPEDYYNEMLKYNRLDNLLKEVRQQYVNYAAQAGKIIENISYVSFSNTYYRKEYAASWLADFKVGIIPNQLLEASIYGTASNWKSIEGVYGSLTNYIPKSGTLIKTLLENRNREIKKIQTAITQGLLKGDGYKQTADIVSGLIGIVKKSGGEITYSGAKANAMRIVRTESNRLLNAAAYANSKYLESKGIDIKRRLLAVLDNRTRRQSAIMDGQTVGVDEPFKYPGGVTALYPGNTGVPEYDINDRETVIEIINGEEPEFRIGRNPVSGENETFSYKDFSTWAKDNGLKKNKYGELIG